MSAPLPFFFGPDLFGIWRDAPNAARVWVLAPPFAEEEKSARRTLTDIARHFGGGGAASLLFSFRGCGDSGGDFAEMGLDEWRADLSSAVEEAHRRAPGAEVALLGVRLGASLCLEVAATRDDIAEVVLIEPLLSGRSFLAQQLMRQKIRAQMTEAPSAEQGVRSAEWDDLDGWPLGARMKADLNALDLSKAPLALAAPVRILQVGPKAEVAPPLRALADKLAAPAGAVILPPFWNLLDYADSAPLLARLQWKVLETG